MPFTQKSAAIDGTKNESQRLGKLEGSEVVARAQDRCSRPEYRRQLDEACSAPETLRLKVGAQVVSSTYVTVCASIRRVGVC